MPSVIEHDVRCPGCGYNLRGLSEARCPECGLGFDRAQAAAGVLRENIPTWLDGCDPWQPHQVLIRSLWELLRGSVRPRRLVRTVDVNGRLAPAVLMLVFGTFWVWLVAAGVVGLAIFFHVGVSPAASLKAGMLVWGPRMVLVGLLPALGSVALLWLPDAVRLARSTVRQRFRLGAYWVPCVCAWCCWVMAAGLLAAPDFAIGVLYLPAAWAGVLSLVTVVADKPIGTSRSRFLLAVSVVGVGIVGGVLGARGLLPVSLEPPLWVYFS